MFATTEFILFCIMALGLFIHFRYERGWIFSPITISWGGFFVFFVLLFGNFSDHKYPKDALSARLCVYFILASVAYFLGLYLGPRILKARNLPSQNFSLPLSSTTYFTLAFCSFFMSIVFWRAGQMESQSGNFLLAPLYIGLKYGSLIFAIRYIIKTKNDVHTIPLKIVCCALILAIFYREYMYTYSRRSALSVIIVVFGVFYEQYLRKLPIAVRVSVLLVALMFMFSAQRLQRATRNDQDYDSKTFTTDVDTSGNQAGDMDTGFFVCRQVTSEFDKTKDFRLGGTYVAGFLYFLPRKYWKSKPETGGGIATEIMRMDGITNVSPTPVGEAYINGGVPAIIIVFALTGVFMRQLNTFVSRYKRHLGVLCLWLCVAMDLLSQWRGDFNSMYVQGVNKITLYLLFVFAYWFFIPYSKRARRLRARRNPRMRTSAQRKRAIYKHRFQRRLRSTEINASKLLQQARDHRSSFSLRYSPIDESDESDGTGVVDVDVDSSNEDNEDNEDFASPSAENAPASSFVSNNEEKSE